MSGSPAARVLRALLVLLGGVAVAAGFYTIVTGVDGMPGGVTASTDVDSELRYYAAFYVGFGAFALHVARAVERETLALRALAAVMFLGGLGRLASWSAEGAPAGQYVALTVIELGLPPLLVALQARAARR